MDAKNILKSKTFWFNIIGAILQVLQTTGVINIPQGILTDSLVAGNIGLRTITTQPVKLS
jgi:uncharacterized membrane protein